MSDREGRSVAVVRRVLPGADLVFHDVPLVPAGRAQDQVPVPGGAAAPAELHERDVEHVARREGLPEHGPVRHALPVSPESRQWVGGGREPVVGVEHRPVPEGCPVPAVPHDRTVA